EIHIFEERKPNGQWLKSIKFKLPIIEENMEVSLDNDTQVETVVLLGRELEKSREHVYLDYEPSKEIDLPGGATYEQIKAYVLEHTGLKVSHLYIAQVKQKHGIIERECYNKPKSEDAKQPQCPPEKEAAIEAALKHFKMI
ncbi:MAG: recombinase family protein, partial [Lachnospiraceae bacterium]